MRNSDRLSWLILGVSLCLAHCATAEQDDPDGEPFPGTGGVSTTGGERATGGVSPTGGVFNPMSKGGLPGASGGATGGKATGGASPSSGSGGRAPTGGQSSLFGGKSGQGGSGTFGGGGDTGDGGEPPVASTGGVMTGTGGMVTSTGGAPPVDPCLDGKRNGSETDVDCGGSCAVCALGMACETGDDCDGGNCAAGTCAVPGNCVYGWKEDACGELCLSRTQSDQRACELVLDCFVENDCGPASCTGVTQVCGNNAIQQGSAPYPYAAQVYDCMCK